MSEEQFVTPESALESEAPEGEPDPLAGLDDVDELISLAISGPDDMTPELAEEPEAPADPPAMQADDFEAEEAEEISPGTEPDQPESGPVVEMEEYLRKIAQGPQRINEIPARHRGEVFRTTVQQAFAAGYQRAIAAQQQQLSVTAQLRAAVAERDAEYEQDPDKFAEWANESPGEAAAYLQAKATLAQIDSGQQAGEPPAGTPPAAPPPAPPMPSQHTPAASPQAVQEVVDRELAPRVAALPESLRGHLSERIGAGEFQRTPEGLAALRSAIATAEHLSKSQQEQEPSPREAAAEARRQTARAAVDAGGSPANEPNPIQHIDDEDELIALAMMRST